MRQYTYYFEVKDLILQFLAAFDNVVIKRYDKNRHALTSQEVRYIYAPKERVLFDLVNPGQNITLPVVSITIGSIVRDNNRVFNKNAGFYAHGSSQADNPTPQSFYYKAPNPVNIAIKMSIIARYQSDMDQILSNFIPFNNINGQQKALIVANTGFTIKGWLFPDPQDPVKNIFRIDTNMTAVSSGTQLTYGSYNTLKSQVVTDQSPVSGTYNTDQFTVSGLPLITGVRLYSQP